VTPFSLHAARTSDQAMALLAEHPGAALLAGGTTLLDLMKLDVLAPEVVIDIRRLDLASIARHGDGWRVGALARNSDFAHDPEIAARCPVLSQAILLGASAQLRNMATVGGNLLQRTRCPYFRDVRYEACNKRRPGSGCAALTGATRMHAVLGTSSQCIATHPGDMAVALAALDAAVLVRGPEGERSVPFTEFNIAPGDTPERETVLGPGELIVALDIPDLPFAAYSKYRKVRDRASYEFALVSCAVALDVQGGVVRQARIALGGVATRPWRCRSAEAVLRRAEAGPDTFAAAAEAALEGAVTRPDNAFKVPLAKRALARTLAEVAEMAEAQA